VLSVEATNTNFILTHSHKW